MAVTVLVRESLAAQRCPPGGAAQKKSAGPHVACRPYQIAYALKPEHRIKDEEWYNNRLLIFYE